MGKPEQREMTTPDIRGPHGSHIPDIQPLTAAGRRAVEVETERAAIEEEYALTY